MDFLTDFIFNHAQHAHFIIFALLMLAGLNVPISEDCMLIVSGVLASTVVPEHTTQLFIWTFLGCYLSDWEAYWIGRLLGQNIWRHRWFARALNPQKIRRITWFYQRYGFLTLLVGRFIPFGVRNCLFITAGLGRMPFTRFLISDGIACLLSNFTLFLLAYQFGKNYQVLYDYTRTWNLMLFMVFLIGVAWTGFRFYQKRLKKSAQAGIANS